MTRTAAGRTSPQQWAAGLGRRQGVALAAGLIVVLVVAVYGVSALRTGFYYDDWSFLGAMHDAPRQTLSGWYDACRATNTPGRPGSCVYHALSFAAFGMHPRGYHALNLALLAGSTFLLFLLMTACRVRWEIALLICGFVIVFPGSDSTRMWPTASVGLLAIAGYLGAVLIAIEALKRRGWVAIALHALTVAIYVAIILTYEIVIPLVLIEGLFLWLALRNRAALVRAAVAPLIALLLVAVRLLVSGVSSASGFNTHHSAGGLLSHYGQILAGGWRTWHGLFLPGPGGVVIGIAGVLLVVGVAVARPEARAPIARRIAVAAVAAAVAGIALAAYVTANDFYVPDQASTFNRLNVAAGLAYCVLFVALLGAVWEALRHVARREVALGVTAALAVAVGASQVATNARSQDAWVASWKDQGVAMHAVRATLPRVPRDAVVISFGHPLWERGYIPVFAASWDLHGAIWATTDHRPPVAAPFASTGVSCGRTGVLVPGNFRAYVGPTPVWFIDTRSEQAVAVRNRAGCLGAVRRFGPQPLWGRAAPSA